MTITPPLIVFDLDGTLVDSAPDLIGALNYVLGREGLPPVPLASARNMIGAGARALIERGLEREGRTVTPQQMKGFTDDFLAYYSEHIADGSQVFEGVDEALDELAASGFRFAICTNKFEALAKRLVDKLGMTSRFVAICGPDTFGVQKPDPAFLRQTVALAGGAIDSAIMVGDSGTDIGVAKRAGVPVIAVSFGYTPVAIETLEPDYLIAHMSELSNAVAEITARRRQPEKQGT